MTASPPLDPGFEELRQIQQTMATALFRPLGAGDHMQRRWVDGRSMRKVAAEFITPNDRLTSFERLEIYCRDYWWRVLDSLYDDFPAVQAAIGARKFHRLITAYLAEHPSESYTLRDLGDRFPQYLRDHPELTAPHTALAIDAARFEWAQVVAFDNEMRPPLALDAALGQDPERIRLTLQPYLCLLELDYPLDDYVIAVRKQESIRSSASNMHAEQTDRPKVPRVKRPAPQKLYMAVHRLENTLYYKRLHRSAFAILTSLRDGQTLAEACEAGALAAEDGFDLPTAIREWFHDWAAMGWLCAAAGEE